MSVHTTNPFKLSIDKISFTFNDISSLHAQKTYDHLIAMEQRHSMTLRSCARYRLQAKFSIMGSASSLLIQTGPRNEGVQDHRIEFTPSKQDAAGRDQIREIINSVTGIGFDQVMAVGKVTRIDVALDLPGLSLEEVIIRSDRQRTFGAFSNSQGDIENCYLGKPKANRTSCYTKKNRKLHDQWLRLERQMRPNQLGSGLLSMANPFECVHMVSTATIEPYLDPLNSQWFFDSVRLRGWTRVVKMLGLKQARAITAALKDPTQTLLPPMAQIWASWPRTVHEGLWGDAAPI